MNIQESTFTSFTESTFSDVMHIIKRLTYPNWESKLKIFVQYLIDWRPHKWGSITIWILLKILNSIRQIKYIKGQECKMGCRWAVFNNKKQALLHILRLTSKIS